MTPTKAAAWLMCSPLLPASALTVQHTPPTPPAPPQHSDSPTPGGSAAAEPAVNGKVYSVPEGTKVLLSLKSRVNTKTARPGDGVYLVSTFPVIVGSHVLIPPGVYVQGVVDKVERPGRMK